jgi:oligosaccharide repeat unit polymerase
MLIRRKDILNLIQVLCILVLITLFIMSLLFLTIFRDFATFNLAVIFSIISTIICIIIIRISNRISTLGVFTVLFIYYTLIHFGASTVYFIFPETVYSNYKPYHYEWLNTEHVIIAIFLCVLAQIVFIFGGIFFGKKIIKEDLITNNYGADKSLWIPRVGFICLIIVLLYFVLNILTGSISLTLGYSEFKEWRKESDFISFALFLLATGYIMVIATGSKHQIYYINILYFIMSIILFLTGNKGEVLYAGLTALGVYYVRFKYISFRIIVLFLALFFIIVPFITATRSGSIINSIDQFGLNLLNPFLETGWQLRTVEKVVYWIENGENFGYGISYWVPVERIISRVTLGVIPPLPIYGTSWSFGERLPGWGFSQVAESFYNFYIFGPIMFYFLQAWFSIKVDSLNVNVYNKALFASIAVILMILTRNRFSFVPGQILMAIVIVLICYVLDGRLKKRNQNNKTTK